MMQASQGFMLDTSITGRLIKGQAAVVRQYLLVMRGANSGRVCISALTKAELLYGLVRNPRAVSLRLALEEFLKRVDVLAWDGKAAEIYAQMRADSAKHDVRMHAQDIMIAAHAVAANCILVTSDPAFAQLGSGIQVMDWTAAVLETAD
jgi:tRNA(fMet)-specific endonuclease VapC